jgi:hypothetical protein
MLKVDTVDGVTTYSDFDDGKFIYKREQDVEAILNHNKALATDGDGYSPSRDIRRVASIPLVVVEQWLSEGVDIFNPDHKAEVRRRLNSSDNAFLRTAPGKL